MATLVKKQLNPERKSEFKTENPDILPEFNDAFFKMISKKKVIVEKHQRVTEILEKVDWSEIKEKP